MCYNNLRKIRLAPNNQRERETEGEFFYMKYVCIICGYTYDEAAGDPDCGIDPGVSWDDIPDDFTCPVCGVAKDEFEIETME